MGDIKISRQSVPDAQCCHRIKTENRQVGQVIFREGFVRKVCMDQAQSPERPLAKPEILEVRQEDPSGVADDYMGYITVSRDEQSDLSVYLLRQLSEKTGKLIGQKAFRRDSPSIESFD